MQEIIVDVPSDLIWNESVVIRFNLKSLLEKEPPAQSSPSFSRIPPTNPGNLPTRALEHSLFSKPDPAHTTEIFFKNPQTPAGITLRKCYEHYTRTRQLRPTTLTGYRRVVFKYLEKWLDRSMAEISDDDLVEKYLEIQGLSGTAQASLSFRVLKAIWSYASVRHGLPARSIGKILSYSGIRQKQTRKTTVIPENSLAKWYRAVQSLSDSRLGKTAGDLLTLSLFLGLRKTEAMTLEWSDVDFPNGTITVRNTKNHSDHMLPIPAALIPMLKARKNKNSGSRFVFPGKDGVRPIRDIDDAVSAVVRHSGVSFTMHDLRRTFATVATNVGIPPYTLKRLLNHRSGNDVTEGYVIATTESLRGPLKLVNTRLVKLTGLNL